MCDGLPRLTRRKSSPEPSREASSTTFPSARERPTRNARRFHTAKIYQSKPVLDIELSGYQIMATLMEVFIDAAVNPSRFYSKQLLRRVSSQYDIENENLEETHHGCIGLHQRHDRHLCLRYLSEDKRHQPAYRIRWAVARSSGLITRYSKVPSPRALLCQGQATLYYISGSVLTSSPSRSTYVNQYNTFRFDYHTNTTLKAYKCQYYTYPCD